MTPERYVARIKALVAQEQYGNALAFAERYGAHVEHQLTPEHLGMLGSLLEYADLGHAVESTRAPVAARR